jgi:Bacterial SH3 domain
VSTPFNESKRNPSAPAQRRGTEATSRAPSTGAGAGVPPQNFARHAERNAPRGRRGEHLPTLAVSAFWFWIVMLILVCGCGTIFITMTPIFPKETAAPPRVVATEPPITATEPKPTATQVPTAAPVTAKVTENVVNLRAGPSTNDKIVGKLAKDDQLTLIGRNQDSTWYQTDASHQKGWVFGQTIQITGGDAKSLPVVQ